MPCSTCPNTRTSPRLGVSKPAATLSKVDLPQPVGPTGCGKSTLLNVAAGLLTPSRGEVKVFGQALQGINARAGYMFQTEALMPWRNALDNVLLGLQYHHTEAQAGLQLAMDWLSRVGLSGFEDRYPHQLSGGMRKRVALAQTLVLDPDIILMDEPFSALDIQTRQLMETEVLELWSRKKKAVLFITHDLRVAAQVCDDVVVMSKGRVVEYGSATQVFGAPSHAYTQALFEAAPGKGFEFGQGLAAA